MYLAVNEFDLAINMRPSQFPHLSNALRQSLSQLRYKKREEYEQMLRLVSKYRKDLPLLRK